MKRTCLTCGILIAGVSLFNSFTHVCRPEVDRSKAAMAEVEYIISDDHDHKEPKTNLRVFVWEVLMQATSSASVSSSFGSGDPPVLFRTEGPRHIITRDPLSPARVEFWTVNVDWRSTST
jgi:hypothetical protein